MVSFSSQTVLLVLAFALAFTGSAVDAKMSKQRAYKQAQATVEGIPDCSDAMYGSHCASSSQGHREFCDHDSSILLGNIPRSICAPLSAMPFLMGKGDYCGKCKPPEGLYVDFIYPTTSPSVAPSVAEEQPIGGLNGSQSPVVPRPTTTAPTVMASAAPSGSSFPSSTPSDLPSVKASSAPSGSSFPSSAPSDTPSIKASAPPSGSTFPSATPTDTPSGSSFPSSTPTDAPSVLFSKTNPLITPAPSGSSFPSSTPSSNPSLVPTGKPSGSSFPSSVPSGAPSTPAPSGSSFPSSVPSGAPSPDFTTESPTSGPTPNPPTPEPVDGFPTEIPTGAPTAKQPPADIPTGGSSEGGDDPTRFVPDEITTAPTTATPSVSQAPTISASPSLPDPPVVAVTTEYSLTFIAEGVLGDDQIETFEKTIRDFLNQHQPLDPNRGMIVIKIDVLAQRIDDGFRKNLRKRKLQTKLPVTADLKIDGIVSPDVNEPYNFGNLVQGVFISHKLVLRNDLKAKGIDITIP